MPTISDITTGASYRGDAGLSNQGLGSFQLDTRPIQQLAQYTYLYNKNLFDQRQKDADEKIKELAKLTAYDLANARGKDKEAGIKALADLTKFGAEFAAKGTPKTPTEKINQQLEYQNKIQEAENTINSINARGIAYMARKNAILKGEADAALKDIQIKQLDDEFDNTDVFTPIAAEPKFDLTVPKIAPPVYKQTEVVVEGANGVVSETLKFFDPVANKNASFLEVNNLDIAPLPANATAAQKNEYAQRLTKKSNNRFWQDAATVLNTAIKDPKYYNDEGQLDFVAIENDNPVLHNTIALIDRYNTYAAQRKQDAINGYYTDKIGNKVKLVQNVRPEDWSIIDVTKPISAVDMVYLQKFADAAPDMKEEKYQYTGAADRVTIEKIQQAGQTQRTRIQEAGDTERARLALTAKVGNGTATSDEMAEYPIVKTQELIDVIGTDGKPKPFSELTPEQQGKLAIQIGEKIDSDALNSASILIKDGNIVISGTKKTGKNSETININIKPDDITKDYYNEINKNDAGKESVKRKYFTIEETKASVNTDAYKSDKTASNWKDNGNGTFTYLPTGQKVDSKTGKIIN